MRFEMGVRLAQATLLAVLGISMAAGLSWGFGGVGIGVGRGGGGGMGIGRGGGNSGAKGSGNSAQDDSGQTDLSAERASLEMGMGPRHPDRGIEGALRWDKAHSGWWRSFMDFQIRGSRYPAAGSEVGGRKTGRKGQEGKEFGALSKGG